MCDECKELSRRVADLKAERERQGEENEELRDTLREIDDDDMTLELIEGMLAELKAAGRWRSGAYRRGLARARHLRRIVRGSTRDAEWWNGLLASALAGKSGDVSP